MNVSRASDKSEFARSFLLVMLYAGCFYGLQFLLHALRITAVQPTAENIAIYDADWYYSVAKNGYQFNPNEQSNSGFFLLFPLVWKLAQLSVAGICFINVLLFAAGFSMLTCKYRVSLIEKLLWLSVPTVFYVFIPYSEALFFFLCSISIWGIATQRKSVIFFSLFLLSLTRATAICLVPAFLLMELLSNDRARWRKSITNYLMVYVLPQLSGLVFFIWYQYLQTGVWFAYFIQQANKWNRKFTLPEFPLTNRPSMVWLSALIAFVGFLSVIFLVKMLLQWYKKGKRRNNILTLSLAYLAMNLVLMLFFNVPTTVWGAFRYGMMNPFFYVFLYYFTGRINYSLKRIKVLLPLTYLIWLFWGAFKSFLAFEVYTLNSFVILCYALLSREKWKVIIYLLLIVNLFFQVWFFQQFIDHVLVD